MSNGVELQGKATRLYEKNKFEEALTAFQEAIAAYEAEGNAVMVAEMRVNLALTHSELDAHDTALELMQESLAYFKETNDQLREAKVLGNMALAYSRVEERDQAETFYREAAILFKQLGENQLYGETILALGDMQFRAGNMMAAITTFETALDGIKAQNQRQKLLKQLLLMKNRMLGGAMTGGEASNEETTEGEAGEEGDEASDTDRRQRRRLRRNRD